MIDWKAVIDAGFRLPEGLSQQAAVDELAAMLGDPDPLVRDELGYTVLVQLIPGLDEPVCRRLGDELAGRFTAHDLHVRSFAALALAPSASSSGTRTRLLLLVARCPAALRRGRRA